MQLIEMNGIERVKKYLDENNSLNVLFALTYETSNMDSCGHFPNEIYLGYMIKNKEDKNNSVVLCNMDAHMCKNVNKNDIIKYYYCDKNVISMFGKYAQAFYGVVSQSYDLYIIPNNYLSIIEQTIRKNKKLLQNLCETITKGMFWYQYASFSESGKYIYAFMAFDDKPNILEWVIRMMRNHSLGFWFAKRIYEFITYYPTAINKLSKHTPNAYKTKEDIKSLLVEIDMIIYNENVKPIINMFNTNQRKILSCTDLTLKQLFLLKKLENLTSVQIVNFIKKVSNIDNLDEIFSLLEKSTDNVFEWNKDSVLTYIEENELSCNVIYDKGNLLILSIFDFEAISRLAKLTNWCISKQKRYWRDYITNKNGNAFQYIIMNFDQKEDAELSMIGVTADKFGYITHSHTFTNFSLVECEYYNVNITNVFNIAEMDIRAILHKLEIPNSVFSKEKLFSFNWEKEAVLKELENYMKYTNKVKIIHQDTDKLVIFANISIISSIFHIENIFRLIRLKQERDGEAECVICFDFSKKENDQDSMYILVKGYESQYDIEYIKMICNKNETIPIVNIDKICDYFSIKLDLVLKCPNSIQSKTYLAIKSFNIPKLFELVDLFGKAILKKSYLITSAMNMLIQSTLTKYDSLSLVKRLYERGIHLKDILSYDDVKDLLFSIASRIKYNYLEDKFMYPKVFDLPIVKNGLINSLDENELFDSISLIEELRYILTTEKSSFLIEPIIEDLDEDYEYDIKKCYLIKSYVIGLVYDDLITNEHTKQVLFSQIALRSDFDLLNEIIKKYPKLINETSISLLRMTMKSFYKIEKKITEIQNLKN